MSTEWTAGNPGAGETRSLYTAQRQIQVELIHNPNAGDPLYGGSTSRALDDALAELSRLASRRKEADNLVLADIRTAVATTWDVEPDQYPANREWYDQSSYVYLIDDEFGLSTDDYTAAEIMTFFKNFPTEVFPFAVSGSASKFEDGAVFTLSDTIITDGLEEPYETGDVPVTTTDTSVKFTVISDTYFDGPGSTIEFSIVDVNGEYVLRKRADAVNANQVAALGAAWAAEQTWNVQAENLKQVVEKHRNQ